MKKEDLLLLTLFLCLLLAAILTILFGGNKSLHGAGASLPSSITEQKASLNSGILS